MGKNIDDILKKVDGQGYGYYSGVSSLDNAKDRLVLKRSVLNCSDKALQYDDMDESIKDGFVVACMKIVLENWSNREELISLQNDMYGFDLVKEFYRLMGVVDE